jgi:hypothetical protein
MDLYEKYGNNKYDIPRLLDYLERNYKCRRFYLIDMYKLNLPLIVRDIILHNFLFEFVKIHSTEYHKLENLNGASSGCYEHMSEVLFMDKVGVYDYLRIIYDYFRLAYLQLEDFGHDLSELSAQQIIDLIVEDKKSFGWIHILSKYDKYNTAHLNKASPAAVPVPVVPDNVAPPAVPVPVVPDNVAPPAVPVPVVPDNVAPPAVPVPVPAPVVVPVQKPRRGRKPRSS